MTVYGVPLDGQLHLFTSLRKAEEFCYANDYISFSRIETFILTKESHNSDQQEEVGK